MRVLSQHKLSSRRKPGPISATGTSSRGKIRVEIQPIRIFAFDKLDFPDPFPFFDLLLSADCRLPVFMMLEPDEAIHTVLRGKTGDRFGFMFPNALREVGRHASKKGSVQFARKQINEEHRASPKWVPAFAGTTRLFFKPFGDRQVLLLQ